MGLKDKIQNTGSSIKDQLSYMKKEDWHKEVRRISKEIAKKKGKESGIDVIYEHIGGTHWNKELTFLKYAEIDNAILINADLSNVNIIRGWVRGSDLSNANLSGAHLWNTDFTYSDLTNANFQDATLTYAILAGTDLKNANFDGAGTWSTKHNDSHHHPICE